MSTEFVENLNVGRRDVLEGGKGGTATLPQQPTHLKCFLGSSSSRPSQKNSSPSQRKEKCTNLNINEGYDRPQCPEQTEKPNNVVISESHRRSEPEPAILKHKMNETHTWDISMDIQPDPPDHMQSDQTTSAEYPRDFLGISLPEQPNKYYFMIRGQRIVLEADSTIQTIMEKLQSYKSRVSLYFEGFQYQLGDFQLRVGKVVPAHSEHLRGIVMEVEYLPISSLDKSRQIMEEFLDIWQETVSKRSLPGHFVHLETNFAEYGLSDHYTSQHTAVQYANVMAQLIATVRN
ncbi:hypothetical protein HHK36_025421 [Tetracentron sinense]|uniref:Mediator of RNA polymerase II transcription subunit 20 n=1 Tax=Tetracentron sinense TaxID=13715 RepID=A0A835D3J5_TETSI|nr:hypothetical protein HHK36_025421 [Tetracentron sinense]